METGKRRSSLRFGLIAAAVILALLTAGLVVFFKVFYVENVIIEGNERYSDEQISDLCLNTPLAYNSVLFSSLSHTIDLSDIAFLDHVTVDYVDKNTIRLTVVETQLVGCFEVNGYYYYFDQTGRVTEVLTSPDEEEGKHVPVIIGVGASDVGLEHVITFEKDGVLNTITAIHRMIVQYDICPDSVEFDSQLNITLHYGTVDVLIGQDDLLEEKMARAAAILPSLEGRSGKLHLENYSSETENIVFDIE